SLAVTVFVLCSVSLRAQTLREFLTEYKIPTSSVPGPALSQHIVPGAIAQSSRYAFVSWSLPGAALRTWPLHLVRMNRQTRATKTGELRLKTDDVCAGPLVDIRLVEDFVLVATDINPSAQCLLVLDPSLRLRQTLYGFEPQEVEPGRIVMIESMIHFAAVHPERLQFVDLATGQTSELYPPKDDALRAELAKRNEAGMPAHAICEQNNDPCDPKLFDETLGPFATNGRGRFAMLADQEADHVTASGEDQTIARQSVVYLYQRAGAGWNWCESRLTPVEANQFKGPGSHFAFDQVEGRCQPTRPVVPDETGAATNQFSKP
ncbi:MAG TPA: hypothetical protein VHE33_21355, partial [Acidobacteriaceae bacterium]|nr:hypothetical protein [Acidobacteriaceae bacterium]